MDRLLLNTPLGARKTCALFAALAVALLCVLAPPAAADRTFAQRYSTIDRGDVAYVANALYDPALAGFGESGGLFSQQASPGFIELWSLQSRMAYGVRNRGKGET